MYIKHKKNSCWLLLVNLSGYQNSITDTQNCKSEMKWMECDDFLVKIIIIYENTREFEVIYCIDSAIINNCYVIINNFFYGIMFEKDKEHIARIQFKVNAFEPIIEFA